MADHADRAAEEEEAVEAAAVDDFLDFFFAPAEAVHHVDRQDADAAVDVEDERVFLRGRDLLDFEGVIEQGRRREVLLRELLQQDDAHVRVLETLDQVADALDLLVLLLHVLDEAFGRQLSVAGGLEREGGAGDGSAEPRADREHAGGDGAHQVAAGAGRDDGVVGAGNAGTVVGAQLEHVLHEARGPFRQALLEPEQADHLTEGVAFRDHLADLVTGVDQLFAGVVRDRAGKVRGPAHHVARRGLFIHHRDRRRLDVRDRLVGALRDELVEGLLDRLVEIVERGRHDGPGGAQGVVFRLCGLAARVGLGAGVAELYTFRHIFDRGAGDPHDERFLDLARTKGFDDAPLLLAADLAETDEHLDRRVGFEAHQVFEQVRTGERIAADGDAFEQAVAVTRDDVVGLVRHAARLADEADRTRPVQLGRADVLDRAAGVADLEGAGRNAADRGRPDDDLAALDGDGAHVAREPLGNPLGDDADSADLLDVERLHRRVVGGAERGEVDHHVDVGVFSDGRGDVWIYRHEYFLLAVEALGRAAAARIDDAGHGGFFPFTAVVEIEHALDRVGLHAEDDRTGVPVEQKI
ncbi:MAG: hypothetical protein BWY66_01422 [bacterium ADurb.Bin374]|nr:MAG: hypothetical protein BWY66_01422 [bacterium ADurb.Bin374]